MAGDEFHHEGGLSIEITAAPGHCDGHLVVGVRAAGRAAAESFRRLVPPPNVLTG